MFGELTIPAALSPSTFPRTYNCLILVHRTEKGTHPKGLVLLNPVGSCDPAEHSGLSLPLELLLQFGIRVQLLPRTPAERSQAEDWLAPRVKYRNALRLPATPAADAPAQARLFG